MTIEARLAELGLTLPPVAEALGSYVPALAVGTTVWTSGQLPMVDGTLMAVGLVGATPEADVSPEQAADCARVATLNGLAAISAAVGGLDRVERIIRVVGYVASGSGFTGQPAVVNGASNLLTEIFGDAGRHTRSAVGVASLPMGAPVEIDIEARLR